MKKKGRENEKSFLSFSMAGYLDWKICSFFLIFTCYVEGIENVGFMISMLI
jgi:hypothetical protein